MNIISLSRALLSFLILFSIFFFTAQTSSAQRSCPLTVAKVAEGAGDLEFPFLVENAEGMGEIFFLADGESFPGSVSLEFSGTIVEEPTGGWTLADVVCEGDGGLSISNVENGISLECIEPTGETTTCTFINVRTVSNIPTLSEWGMIAAAAGLGLVGVFFAARRRKAKAV